MKNMHNVVMKKKFEYLTLHIWVILGTRTNWGDVALRYIPDAEEAEVGGATVPLTGSRDTRGAGREKRKKRRMKYQFSSRLKGNSMATLEYKRKQKNQNHLLNNPCAYSGKQQKNGFQIHFIQASNIIFLCTGHHFKNIVKNSALI